MKITSPKKRALMQISITLSLLIVLVLAGTLFIPDVIKIAFDSQNESLSLTHIFGTDFLGRDMLARTLKGLTLSLGVGILAAFLSVVIALSLSFLASLNRMMDGIVTWLIDLFLSLPHLVFLILIAFALGGGLKGVIIGVALTHWPRLTRLLRAEILQLKQSDYVAVSERLGKSRIWISLHHFTPHLLPQLLVGFVLLFPHAILHEAAITFLGFGLSSEQPAIGIILSESMQYLSAGYWWLAFFPGLLLLVMVACFDLLGRGLRVFLDPFNGQK